jgi:hypothetical protein
METFPSPTNQTRPGFITRFFRGLFSWRTVRRALIAFVGLITLIALLWTEENWRGRRAWEKYRSEEEAKGERFDFASFAPRPVPDDQNFFMAPIWAGVFNQQWDSKTGDLKPRETNVVDHLQMTGYVECGLKSPERGGNWQKRTITDLKPWQEYYRQTATLTNLFPVAPQPQTPAKDVLLALSKYDSAIEALRQASQRPDSRLPLDDTDLFATVGKLLPVLADIKNCSWVLQLRVIAELADDQSAKALDDVKLMFRLTDSTRNEPLLISQLVRIAMLSVTLQPIYEGLAEHQWTDAQLADLGSELAKMDFLGDYEFAIRGDRAYGITMLRYWPQYHGINPFYHHWELAFARECQQWILPCVNLETRVVSPATVRRLQEAEAVEWKRTTPYNVLAKRTFPAISKTPVRFAFCQTGVDLTRVACALERHRLAHGEYPASLDVLVPQFIEKIPHDIINGQPLHYRRTSDGQFVLYSVGWNEKDDGGTVVLTKDGAVDTKNGDWVWQYPGK